MTTLLDTARRWVADDPDAATRAELEVVIAAAEGGDAAALADIEDRFRGTLEFGTAGLRGAVGAGPNRMNRAVVIRAAAGLARYLSDSVGPSLVVIGFDGRHGSVDFANDTAAVMVAAGHRAKLMPRMLPTPMLAYATRALDADAGVMVTASHNPPRDNGYKVYLGGRAVTDSGQGAQIVPPYDAEIASRIAAVESVLDVPRAEGGWEIIPDSVVDEFVHAAAALGPDADGRRANTRVVITSMHGVGSECMQRALAEAGFTDVHEVAEQAVPDPNFPTVAFPNPEEKGAIDLSIALAREAGADVVIANDPDADRCAVATVIDGEWRMLHGDVVGSLLGEKIAAHRALLRMAPGSQVFANSIVSSRQLKAIAEHHGHSHVNTLTGFKWLARVPGLVYGYEEAIGYCVDPAHVRDKDGISAGTMMAVLVADLKAQGRTLADAIDDLARSYGVYLTRQVAVRYADLAEIPATMARLLASPPETLGGHAVTATDDMGEGFAGLLPTSGLHLATESGARVIIRPSGTEPKVKAYLEVIVPVAEGDVASARAEAEDAMAALEADVKGALGV
ncbi:phospho-sugar mutase [Demequina sp.]|uniref:phospho-sugar mutase n=1 Tax=Demequina sp. TaxID=2050685 RepID=UPI003D09ACC5